MTTDEASRLRDHWWPRPGWRPGRIMLTWHVTFENATDLRSMVAQYQRALDGLPGLSIVPVEWLHLTVQGVGYEDETPHEDVTAVVRAVRKELSALSPFDLTFGRPLIFGEAIAIRPEQTEPLQHLLTAIRSAIANALGTDAVPTGPEQAHGFRPHLTIAYSGIDADATPYREALGNVQQQPVTVTVATATLIRQERQLNPQWLYRWTVAGTAPLPS